MKDITNMPTETAGAAFLIGKFGLVKLMGFGAALLGAGIMAIFRPPKNRKELFAQGAVALGASLLFGGSAVNMLAGFDVFGVNLKTSPMADIVQFNAMVHGLIGAMAWGIFGGLAVFRDKFGSNPVEAIKDVRGL
jgi:hypothetical protein